MPGPTQTYQIQILKNVHETEPEVKVAGSVWLPGPEVCRKLEGQIEPDCARISLYLQKETESSVVWVNLVSFLQYSFKLLVQETREPAFFVWHEFVWLCGPW